MNLEDLRTNNGSCCSEQHRPVNLHERVQVANQDSMGLALIEPSEMLLHDSNVPTNAFLGIRCIAT